MPLVPRKSDFATHQLTLWALRPRSEPVSRDVLAARLGISRTPLADAVSRLATVGLVDPSGPVVSRFGGPVDVRRRAAVLAAALDAGRLAGGFDRPADGTPGRALRRSGRSIRLHDLVSTAVFGRWGADSWNVLLLWPERCSAWGVDPEAEAEAVRRLLPAVRTACAEDRLADALDGVRAIVGAFAVCDRHATFAGASRNGS